MGSRGSLQQSLQSPSPPVPRATRPSHRLSLPLLCILSGFTSRSRKPEYGRRDPSRGPLGTFCPQKLALTSPTSGGRSVGIVFSRIKTMEFSFLVALPWSQRIESLLL
jgi:hypothetical protein